MKRWFIALSASMLFLLSGCSFLNDAQDSLTYINEATEYLEVATNFANEAPALAQQAIEDIQAAEDLKVMLEDMQQQIESFNELQAPQMAADLHQQIVEQNAIIAEGIETYLTNIKDGLLDPTVLENSELFQSVQDITNIIDQIQQLGEQ
ncbi:DUF6376 family protein [Neobacillus sp. K501]